jgi:glycine/D-amino acid oxidase-like deaminating enzyme
LASDQPGRPRPPAASGALAVSRRAFLGAGLAAGACRPGRPRWTGGIVGASHQVGHLLRDRSFATPEAAGSADVIVVGGGMSGLIAAWRLQQAGRRVLVLELETEVGGHAASGRNAVSAHPWGAHYVPVPTAEMTDVCALFSELGLGAPGAWREEFICHDPDERLWRRGRWQEGLVPAYGVETADRNQLARFLASMEKFKTRRGTDGRRAFALPSVQSSQDSEFTALDSLTMAAWLDREGFTSPEVRWLVDYSCRDDYGAGSDSVSAWAGVHYFASRDTDDVLTWPEGNGWIVQQLRQRLGDALRPGHLVTSVTPEGAVTALEVAAHRMTRWQANHVVCAAPRFIAQRLIPDLPEAAGLEYSPWMVANLTLARDLSPVWDNVLRDSRSLGYVVATHQQLRPRTPSDPTVITYYRPLDDAPPAAARQQALARSYADWCQLILDDLRGPHPQLADDLRHLDVWLWGHGMARPTPGLIFGPTLDTLRQPHGRIVFAHTDLSGFSVFEEACHWGHEAARTLLSRA